jgi:hypothetical protein
MVHIPSVCLEDIPKKILAPSNKVFPMTIEKREESIIAGKLRLEICDAD